MFVISEINFFLILFNLNVILGVFWFFYNNVKQKKFFSTSILESELACPDSMVESNPRQFKAENNSSERKKII